MVPALSNRLVWASFLGGHMKWINCRGGFVKYHPPPMNSNQVTTRYIGNSGVSITRLKAFTFKHPPPCPENQGYQNRQNIYGTKERRPRNLIPPPRGMPGEGMDSKNTWRKAGDIQDFCKPGVEWVCPYRAKKPPQISGFRI